MAAVKSDRVPPKHHYAKSGLIKLTILFLISTTQAQMVSNELRRLALATNQFGIDSLRALDKIEPPDKVLVFCPVCLSSTLMMIMMGSSKYHVVSSLRHALYVWSMRPQDINNGFRDIFHHIGLNQDQTTRLQSTMLPAESRRTHLYATTMNPINDEIPQYPANNLYHYGERSLITYPKRTIKLETLSLPKLIRLKDILENSSRNKEQWWQSMSKRHNGDNIDDPLRQNQSENLNQTVHRNSKLIDPRDATDSSQISAMCNIYIQRGLTVNYNYNILLRQYYETVIHPVDFFKNTEETRQHINALVAANTENKIKDLIKRGHFDQKVPPKIMMISTFHFRGTLDIEMKSKNTPVNRTSINLAKPPQRRKRSNKSKEKRQPKQVRIKTSQFIETEPTLLKYGHFSNMDCSVIEIPFNNRLVTLVIVMPDRKNLTDLLLEKLSAQILSDMTNSLVVKKLSLEIPVIKFDRGPINTEALLKGLSLNNLFFGNQTYSSETGLNRWMRATDIIHETSIDIGTLNPNWGVPEDRLKVGAHEGRTIEANHLKLDKPFFYFVMDSMNSLILTTGRVRQ
jgi:serine protease inhibitor